MVRKGGRGREIQGGGFPTKSVITKKETGEGESPVVNDSKVKMGGKLKNRRGNHLQKITAEGGRQTWTGLGGAKHLSQNCTGRRLRQV